MAKDYTALAEQMVAPVYNQLESGANEQIKTAETDPYYNALLSGLDATKNREFSGIESRAAQRGVAYGNIPTQLQSVYLGEKYLPAVAEVKRTQQERINSLKQTLAELRSKRAGAVLDQANLLEGRDYEAEQARIEREFKAQQAAADRAASASSSANISAAMEKANMTSSYNQDLSNLGRIMMTTGMTREQAAQQLAIEHGTPIKDVLENVYQSYGDGWELPFYRTNYGSSSALKTGEINQRYRDILRPQVGR